MDITTITIYKDYITLGQALKELKLILSGGQAKYFLADNEGQVYYNGQPENRRGKKIYPGDELNIRNCQLQVKFIAASPAEQEAQQAAIETYGLKPKSTAFKKSPVKSPRKRTRSSRPSQP